MLDESLVALDDKSGVPGKFWEQDGLGLYLACPGTNTATGRYHTLANRPWQDDPIIQLTPSTERWGEGVLNAGSKWACTLSDKGYTVEAAVPWASLGWQPQAGDRVLFSAILGSGSV